MSNRPNRSNRLIIRLLGPLDVAAPEGQVAPFEAATARALLAYLAANHAQPQLRSKLAALLWGADAGPTGLTNLRSALRRVRNAVILEDGVTPCLLSGRDVVQLNPDIAVEVDIEQFDNLLRAVQSHAHAFLYDCVECAERQRQAAALYRGTFLADLDIPSEEFEQWRSWEQERCRREIVHVLSNLAEYEMRCGSMDEAERLVQRQLALEHWNEESHCQLMRILLATGRRSAALAQYDLCCRVLDAELGVAPSEETDALYAHIMAGAPPAASRPADNPYKSLDAFGAADAAYFFGREQVVEQMAAAVHTHSLLALIGPSGSGKSSAIHAGLGPALGIGRQKVPTVAGAAHWRLVSLRPGPAPLQALADALLASGQAPLAHDTLVELLLSKQIALPTLVADWQAPAALEQGSDAAETFVRYLLVVDQFEEIFTLCRDGAVRSAFLHFLLSALTHRSGEPAAATVLLAMRADFLGEALQYSELAAALQEHALLLGPMGRRDVQRAIEEPARLQGVVFEPGLVERLLDDVGSEPGRLPLLQFALAMLWLRQQDGWLTHAIYDEIGGVRGALAEYTDDVYLQLALAEQQEARSVFLNLVEPGLNAQDVRRLATRSEIGEASWPIVQRLADARLLVTNTSSDGEETAELAHEALIREWKRLREWLASDRVFRNWQQQMRSAAEHWRQSGHDEGSLLRGVRLAEAERWLSERHADINPLLRRYVEAGIALREQRRSDEEARRTHELAQAQALAAAEYQRAEFERAAHLRFRRLAAGVALATLVALAAAGLAVRAQREAEHNARIAQSRQITAQAINVMRSQPDLALLLGVEALRLDDSADSKMALYSDLDVHPMLLRILHGPPPQIYTLGMNRNRLVLASNEQGAVVAWDAASGQQSGVLDVDPQVVGAAAASPDGTRFATADGAQITIWDAADFSARVTLDGHTGRVTQLAFTRDGQRLVSAGDDRRVLVWDVGRGVLLRQWFNELGRAVFGPIGVAGTTLLLGDSPGSEDGLDMWDIAKDERVGRTLLGHTDAVHGYAVNPDETLLATASFDGSVRLWDSATGAASGEPLIGHDGRVLFVAFSPDGRTLATGGTDRQVTLWDTAARRRLGGSLAGHANSVRTGHFSADGAVLATGDEGGDVLLWDLQRLRPLLGHSDRVRSLAVGRDGATLVTSGFDRRLIIWDAVTLEQRQVITTPHKNSIIRVDYGPDGSTFVSIDAGGGILFWDPVTWQPRFPLQQSTDGPLIGLSFSPDGRTVASGAFDGVVRFWDVTSGQQLPLEIPAYTTGWALSVRFAPTGKLLATGGGDGVIKLWDAATGDVWGAPLVGHTNRVTDLVFSPDDAMLTSASSDGTIRFWDVAAGREVADPLRSSGAQVWSIGYADGAPQRLLGLNLDGSVADWNVATHILNRPLVHTYVETEEMRVPAAGEQAFIASMGPAAQVLALPQGDWRTEACHIANRTLSEDEWRKYMRQLPYDPACGSPGSAPQ